MRTAEDWIQKLNLDRHPTAGYFLETYRSPWNVATPDREGGERSAHTMIYYMMLSHEIGYWRHIKSDEAFHFYAGGDLRVHMIDAEAQLSTVLLGNGQYDADAILQFTVPANTWFALEVAVPDSYSLVAACVTPGFDYRDYHVVDKSVLLQQYPQHQAIIERLGKPDELTLV